jgi:hypothetical protein
MAGTITVKEVVRRISVLMQDDSPQFARMTEVEIIDFLNDAQRAVFKFLPAACARIDAVKLAPGTLQSIESIAADSCKPGDGSTPAAPIVGSLFMDVVCNMGSAGLSPGRAIRAMTEGREFMDAFSPNWHAEVGVEVKEYTFDPRMPRHFHVTPGVHPNTPVWVRLAYVAEPLLIANTGAPGSELYLADGNNTTTIGVHDEHIDDLVNYTCARLLMKNAQYGAATGMSVEAFGALFTGSINAKAVAIMGYNPNLKHLPFAPSPIGAAS